MELKINKDELGDLEDRSHEFIRSERIYRFNMAFCFLWFLLPVIIGATVKPLTILEGGLLVLLGIGLAVASLLWPSRRMKDYNVKDAEWARLYSYAIYNNIADYFDTESSGTKKKNRQFAVTNTKSLLIAVEQNWNVGSFSLVEDCRKAVTDFGKNLKYRVIPALGSNDDDKLRRISGLMFNLFHWSNQLTIQKIETLNQQMSTKDGPRFLESTEPKRITYGRIVGLVKDKRIQPYFLPVAVSGIGSVILFLVLMTWFGSNLTVISVAVILFVGLLQFLRPTRKE